MSASRRAALILSCVAAAVSARPVRAQDAGLLPLYQPAQRVSGTIRISGSPQMGDLMKRYEAGFHRVQPGVRFEYSLQSTLSAVPDVGAGKADISLLGREIWPSEMQAFQSAEGYPPLVVEIATGSFDVPKATFALMVFVPAANPIPSLSIAQLAQIFGEGGTGSPPIRTWGDLGLTGPWADRPIHLDGFGVDNDKSKIFSQMVFTRGQHWKSNLRQFTNTAGPHPIDAGEAIIRAVSEDPDAIGISNVHYATPSVRAVPLSAHSGAPAVPATRATVASRAYPLSRAVCMVTRANPSAAVTEFLRFILSRNGAEAVREEGNYLPLTPAIAATQRAVLKPD